MAQDRITLTVPARGEYAKTVRMTAAALVSRMGMTYDQVDDVRMAAEEAFIYAVESVGEDCDVRMEFLLSDDAIELSVCLGESVPAGDPDLDSRAAYATFILQSVCDRYEFASDVNGIPYLRLMKRVGDVDAG